MFTNELARFWVVLPIDQDVAAGTGKLVVDSGLGQSVDNAIDLGTLFFTDQDDVAWLDRPIPDAADGDNAQHGQQQDSYSCRGRALPPDIEEGVDIGLDNVQGKLRR